MWSSVLDTYPPGISFEVDESFDAGKQFRVWRPSRLLNYGNMTLEVSETFDLEDEMTWNIYMVVGEFILRRQMRDGGRQA